MKIAIITSWFSEKMGYSENFFPKALASLGHEVHVITSTAQVYYNTPMYEKTYKQHLGPSIVEKETKDISGFKLHRLDFTEINSHILNPFQLRGIKINNLIEYLEKISPDIVQVVNGIEEPTTYDAAIYSKKANVKFFTESHLHASVLRVGKLSSLKEILMSLSFKINPKIREINKITNKCYPIAPDVAEIVRTLYHVPKEKIKIQPLGVDTEFFCQPNNQTLISEREELRKTFGFENDDLVCLYTGRFSPSKNPFLLAEAIDLLQQKDEKIKGLFIGNGSEKEIEQISINRGCIVHPFVTVQNLPKYYRCADIGVWPREESTSQLDAASCGLPLILSNKIHVTERVTGNGFLYEEGNKFDLADKILKMKPIEVRKKFSSFGVEKINREYSWLKIAKERLRDYQESKN